MCLILAVIKVRNHAGSSSGAGGGAKSIAGAHISSIGSADTEAGNRMRAMRHLP